MVLMNDMADRNEKLAPTGRRLDVGWGLLMVLVVVMFAYLCASGIVRASDHTT
jgi:hypothetical protein